MSMYAILTIPPAPGYSEIIGNCRMAPPRIPRRQTAVTLLLVAEGDDVLSRLSYNGITRASQARKAGPTPVSRSFMKGL